MKDRENRGSYGRHGVQVSEIMFIMADSMGIFYVMELYSLRTANADADEDQDLHRA